LVDGDEIGLEVSDLLEVFEADNTEAGCSETVAAGVLGGDGFAFGSAGAGGKGGVGAVGGERGWGDRTFGLAGGLHEDLRFEM
jgi:hypothetical protein